MLAFSKTTVAPCCLLLVLAFFTSCRTQNLFGLPRDEKPKPDSSFLTYTASWQYTIRKDDKISISVWDHDELSVGSLYGIYNSNEVYGKWLLVNARGEINCPKIGPFHIQDLTVMQAEDSLCRLYAEWIRHPVIDVKVLNKEVTMLGELKSPGKLLLEKDNNSLVELIGKAGDFDFYANKKKVQVIRNVGGLIKTMQVDLTRMDGYSTANLLILPGDVVYVPSRRGKDFDKRISTILPLISILTGFAVFYKTFF